MMLFLTQIKFEIETIRVKRKIFIKISTIFAMKFPQMNNNCE